MSMALELPLSYFVAQCYQDGITQHGDVGVSFDDFEKRLTLVIEKHLGANASITNALRLLCKLHTTDLYLAVGCSEPNDDAWRRLVGLYGKNINDISRSITGSSEAGRELAADVLSSLFLHDRTKKSRIASYDGQQSLWTWLVAVISHRAANTARRTKNRFEPLDSVIDLKCYEMAERIESELRASSYRGVIRDCFNAANASLTNYERLILLLRFEQGLRIVEIGEHLNVDPSRITRLLQQTYVKLRKKMISYLANTCHLRPAAISECLTDILENPEHSIIALLRDASENDTGKAVARA